MGRGNWKNKKQWNNNWNNSWSKNNKKEGGNSSKHSRGSQGDAGWGYENIVKHNELFNEYYQGQGIVPEGEWDDFINTLKRPLPITFRINGSGRFAASVRDKLETDFFQNLDPSIFEPSNIDELLQPPQPLPWYPDKLAWQMNFSRGQLRKIPALERIHEFIKTANESGTITRQEAVSMVPPLFMDVQPHHAVLDICAAPGSKTFQLIEALHGAQHVAAFEPTGFVLANDIEAKRCNLLTHQTKRSCSPCLLVTNHDATMLPTLPAMADLGGDDGENGLRFDRILADVPCSGDGTMRKNADLWRKWTAGLGVGMHALQLRIAVQSARFLKVGGKMVYSTCSLSPMEDESVIAELLRQTEGALELEDVSGVLPALKRMPGMKTWRVRDKHGWKNHYGEEGVEQAPNIVPSMFPQEDCKDMPLERCMRFLPQHADTGGFFVVVLRKVAELPDALHPRKKQKTSYQVMKDHEARKQAHADPAASDPSASAAAADPAATADPAQQPPKEEQTFKRKSRWNGIDPVLPVTKKELIQSLVDFYGIAPEFPIATNLVTRTPDEQRPKRLYYVSSGVKRVLMGDTREQLKIIATGLKCFERQEKDEVKCAYRLSQEGLPFILKHISKQKLVLPVDEWHMMICRRQVAFKGDAGAAAFKPETIKAMLDMELGCCVAVPDLDHAKLGDGVVVEDPSELAVVCWRGHANLNLLVSKPEAQQFLDRCGLAPLPVEESEAKDKGAAEEAAEPAEEAAEPAEEAAAEPAEGAEAQGEEAKPASAGAGDAEDQVAAE